MPRTMKPAPVVRQPALPAATPTDPKLMRTLDRIACSVEELSGAIGKLACASPAAVAEAAVKAGLPVIGVLCGGFPEADLSEAGCGAIYRDPQDLLDGYASSMLRRGLP